MTKKSTLPNTAPRFTEGEWAAAIVTVILCAISSLALAYHIYSEAPDKMPDAITWAFTVLWGLFAFCMGLVPMLLARAHGSSMEGGSAQSGLTFVVFLFILVDMGLQVHAVYYLIEQFSFYKPHIGWIIGGAAAFQVAAFVVRGALYGATREIQDLIDARAHEAELAAAYAKEAYNAKRRETYAEKKGNVVNMR